MTDGTGEEPRLAAELERIRAIIRSPRLRDERARLRRPGGAVRPRDAATIIIVDGSPGRQRILMGKRNRALAFMPGALVFPGGSVDRGDAAVPSADVLHPDTERRIIANLRGRPSRRRARGLAMAAIRELGEETGLLVGEHGLADLPSGTWAAFGEHGLVPAIGRLSLLSRAITPPGMPRRFDTWFFVVGSEAIGHQPTDGFRPSGELEELAWLTPEEAIAGATREITRVMIVELMHRLERDPGLDPGYPAPFYRAVRNRFHKDII
ncbi:MAG: NUDIX hydrolase [Alphaproteobacteria bacterium]|nr:MAG: NUDIX hydrolase [Alphaproteobacteria bacterium]